MHGGPALAAVTKVRLWGALGVLTAAATAGTYSSGAAIERGAVPPRALFAADGDRAFRWRSGDPLIKPSAGSQFYAVKDPTIVRSGGKYHVFMTTAGPNGWGIAYTAFRDWREAGSAPVVRLDRSPIGPGYRAAPQVFYFRPQRLWYLIYQGGDPLYSTTSTIDDPMSWSAPKPFFTSAPSIVRNAAGQPVWLDFWTICDARTCYLFNTGDNGRLYRSETSIDRFPQGFGNTVEVMRADKSGDLFEASMTYRVTGTNAYVTMVEAIGPRGRYFRSWTADRLGGAWRPLADSDTRPFAGAANVTYAGARWSADISHGELIRDGRDETLSIDPCRPLRFLYQGRDPASDTLPYIELPYRLGLLTADRPNPISRMCRAKKR